MRSVVPRSALTSELASELAFRHAEPSELASSVHVALASFVQLAAELSPLQIRTAGMCPGLAPRNSIDLRRMAELTTVLPLALVA